MARAQGIPDSVTFQLAERVRGIKSLTKQIGNAVPVPMAAAIGKELLKAEHRSRNSKARRHESVEL
jgi:site-specific DNA-cytosine methylase